MRPIAGLLSLCALIVMQFGCESRSRVRVHEDRPVRVVRGQSAYLSGNITSRESIAVPSDAVVVVRLIEEHPDGRRAVIRTTDIRNPRAIPVAYRLPYEPESIRSDCRYYVEASIDSPHGGWTTLDRYPVLVTGQPARGADIVLVRSQRTPNVVAQYGRPVANRTVSGTVLYRERMALPSDAVVRVNLIEIQRDGRRAVVGGTSISQPRSVPVPFSFEHRQDQFRPDCRYELESVIEGNSGRWRSVQPYPINIANDKRENIELEVVRR